ncbi:MAG: MoaD/ThiS family protein [SAR202 cluster bacterium]|nr:MoaD/ThiS family protein [SAR202 cluster bacterium]
MARVFVPYNMRKLAGGKTEVNVPGKTLRELIENLEARFPGMKELIVEDDRLKPGLAAIVGEQPTRQGLMTKLEPETEVHFLPAISGG